MLGKCFLVALAVGAAVAYPRARPQHPQQQQQVGIPPHLLRQYLAQQQQRDATPIYEQDGQHTQVLPPPAPQPQQIRYSQVQGLVQRAQQAPAPAQYVQQYQAPAPAARPQQRPAPLPEDQQEDYDPNPSYQFGFDVNDDQYTNYQNRKEQRDGDVIKGSYSVVDSDGFIRTVTYTADPKEGFKAEVSRQPTDIVVKVPTPKPQEQQLIQRPIPQQQQQQHQQQHQQQQQQSQQQPPQYYRYQ